MPYPECVLENKMRQNFWDHLILVRCQDHVIFNKRKNLLNTGLSRADGPQSKNEKIDKYQELARELKKMQNMKMTMLSIIAGAF